MFETNMTKLWERLYDAIQCDSELSPCRSNFAGDNVKQCTGVHFALTDVGQSLVLSPIRNTSLKYLIAEMRWYNAATTDCTQLEYGSGVWKSLTTDGINVNSNYGHKTYQFYGYNQFEDCYNRFCDNINTRQAVIHIKNAEPFDSNSKDVCCTLTFQMIWDNTHDVLDGILNMRSCDMWTGIVYDVPFYVSLLQRMAKMLGVKCGVFHGMMGSLHIYEKNLNLNSKYHVPNLNMFPIYWPDYDDIIFDMSLSINTVIQKLCALNPQFALLNALNAGGKHAE